jgi:hypothetical protein
VTKNKDDEGDDGIVYADDDDLSVSSESECQDESEIEEQDEEVKKSISKPKQESRPPFHPKQKKESKKDRIKRTEELITKLINNRFEELDKNVRKTITQGKTDLAMHRAFMLT